MINTLPTATEATTKQLSTTNGVMNTRKLFCTTGMHWKIRELKICKRLSKIIEFAPSQTAVITTMRRHWTIRSFPGRPFDGKK